VSDTSDEVQEQLIIALRRSRRIAREAAESVHPGLEAAAVAFLVRLDAVGPSRPSDLAAYLQIGKSTAGRQLSALEDRGLVARQPDPDDRRAHLLALTDEGTRRLEAARTRHRQAFRERLSTWSEADLATLATLLTRLNTDSLE
jgi:DNA-binding MarR family transcriptional regulator